MEELHRTTLRKERIYLLRHLSSEGMIVEHLYVEGVLTEDEKDNILCKATPKEKRSALLDLLPRRGPTAFPAFLRALRSEECRSGFIASYLEESVKVRGKLKKGLEEVTSHIHGIDELNDRNEVYHKRIFDDIDCHLEQSVEQLKAQAESLKADVREKCASVKERGLKMDLWTLANDLEKAQNQSSISDDSSNSLLNRIEPLIANTRSLLAEPVPFVVSNLKFTPMGTSELILGKLEVPNVPYGGATPSHQQREPDEPNEPLRVLNQTKPVPAKPRLVMRMNFRGLHTAFDPEGNLLCLRRDGTASLIGACTESVINNYKTYITDNVWSLAISNNKVAIIHWHNDSRILKLVNRTINYIDFTDGLTQVKILNGPYKCAFTCDMQHLLVSEEYSRSMAILNDSGNLIKRIQLNFEPWHIAVDEDDSFYVTHYKDHQIHHFRPDGSTAGVLKCRDESGNFFIPECIIIDQSSRRLFVNCLHDNRILQQNDDCFVKWLDEADGVFRPFEMTFNRSASHSHGRLAVSCIYPHEIILYDMK